ncbi:MAG TPA: hypothetical protein VMX17_05645 [Candidatus Glassbacteria bacterium]|jgi:DNA-directed RNA polymerase subunit RPC12/RpoP|nr:hypothetical protein [Candidatus Glassbacteria bacterium]
MKTWTNLEPVEADIHLKYKCPSCGSENWLSYKETKIQDFKVFCEICENILTPKPVKSITVNFIEQQQKQQEQKQQQKKEEAKQTENDLDFISEAENVLIGFGFTKREAKEMIALEYKKTGEKNPAKLVKFSLDLLGAL